MNDSANDRVGDGKLVEVDGRSGGDPRLNLRSFGKELKDLTRLRKD